MRRSGPDGEGGDADPDPDAARGEAPGATMRGARNRGPQPRGAGVAMKVLVFGATGQVATALRRRAGPGLALRMLARADADLADPEACAARIARGGEDVVINAAAYTAVDRAEDEAALAMRVNAAAPTAMAAAAAARGAPFLHLSTDCVFDGARTGPWREDDPTGPLSAYGRSKLTGEQGVAAAAGPHAVLRTAWVFSAGGSNFLRTMLRLGAERDTLRIVDDQIGGPTPADAVADALLTIAGAFAAGRGVSGVFHFTGAPTVSWRGFAEEIFRRVDWFDPPMITPIASADHPAAARRPANSTLDCARIASVYGLAQPDWRADLDAIVRQARKT